MNRTAEIVLAILPTLLTPVLFYALAEGLLNLGGGEKDILWIFPWLIWSLLFAISGCVFIVKGRSVLTWIRDALVISVSVILLLFLLLFILSYTAII